MMYPVVFERTLTPGSGDLKPDGSVPDNRPTADSAWDGGLVLASSTEDGYIYRGGITPVSVDEPRWDTSRQKWVQEVTLYL